MLCYSPELDKEDKNPMSCLIYTQPLYCVPWISFVETRASGGTWKDVLLTHVVCWRRVIGARP